MIDFSSVSRRSASGSSALDGIVYVRAIWRRRYAVVAASIVAAVIVYLVSLFVPPTYEATATMTVTQSSLGETTTSSTPPNIAAFHVLLQNRSLAAVMMREFPLTRPPYNLTPEQFLLSAVRVDEVYNAPVLQLKVMLRDPQLAANVANRLAELAIDLNKRVNQNDGVTSRDFLKQELDSALANLNARENALLGAQRTAQLDVMERDTKTRLDQRDTLLNLLVDIEAQKARVAKVQDELSRQSQTVTLTRSVDSNAAMMESARQAGRSGNDVLRLQMQDQEVNRVFEQLQRQASDARSELAGLERRRDELMSNLKVDGKRVASLDPLYTERVRVKRLEMEYDVAKRTYQELAGQYDTVRVRAGSHGANLALVDPATPPNSPSSPRKLLNAGIAGVVTFVGSIVLLVLVTFIRTQDLDGVGAQTP